MATANKEIPQRLLTYAEACEILAIQKSTLYQLVSKGQLPVVRFGNGKRGTGCTRFRMADLQAFIDRHVSKLA